ADDEPELPDLHGNISRSGPRHRPYLRSGKTRATPATRSAAEREGRAAHDAVGVDVPLLVTQEGTAGRLEGGHERVEGGGAAPAQRVPVVGDERPEALRIRGGQASAAGAV